MPVKIVDPQKKGKKQTLSSETSRSSTEATAETGDADIEW
jgi:hypothetical protein